MCHVRLCALQANPFCVIIIDKVPLLFISFLFSFFLGLLFIPFSFSFLTPFTPLDFSYSLLFLVIIFYFIHS